MRKCHHCLQSFIGSGDYCGECRRTLLNLQSALEVEEKQVADFATVASWALHGEAKETVRRWVAQ